MASILVVDDHPDSREVLCEMLAMHGHSVAMTDSAELAWDKLHQSAPDVLVIDQRLPGMTGIELLKRVRITPHLARLWVVLCSADDTERQAANSAGADGFWLKGSTDMFDAVARLTDRLDQVK
jgi:CheY-like chemotaxis protein